LKKIIFYKSLLISLTIFISNSLVANINSDTAKKEPIIKLNGSISLGYWMSISKKESADNTTYTQTPNWYISGQPTITVMNVDFPFSGTYSNQEFDYTQPFNQYGLSPTYKWATFHIGYRNLKFSDFTMAGVTFLGGGLELNPGKLRVGLFYGRFAKGISEDSVVAAQQGITIIPTYERWGYGLKLGYGSLKNHIDFIATKLYDDTSSIKNSNDNITPSSNVTVGVSSKFSVFKRIHGTVDAGLSLITKDIRLDTLPFPELNQYKSILPINASTMINPAFKAGIGYSGKLFDISVQSDYIGPNYESLGIYFIQNDLFRTTIRPKLKLFKRKLNISGSYGIQSDNVADQKIATTTRLIQSGNISLSLIKGLILQGNFSNYGTDQSSGKIQLNDSIRVSQVNQCFGGSIMYSKMGEKIFTNVSATYNQQSLNDLNVVTAKYTESDIKTTSLMIGMSHSPSKLSLGLGLLYNDINVSTGNSVGFGPSLSFSSSLFKGKVSFNSNASYQSRRVNSNSDGNILTVSSNLTINAWDNHRIGLRSQYSKNNSSSQSIFLLTQNRIGFTYGYSF